jgi:hypothetical protein
VKQDDDGTRGFLHDLLDQPECVIGALSQPDERDVGPLLAVTGPTSSTSSSP